MLCDWSWPIVPLPPILQNLPARLGLICFSQNWRDLAGTVRPGETSLEVIQRMPAAAVAEAPPLHRLLRPHRR